MKNTILILTVFVTGALASLALDAEAGGDQPQTVRIADVVVVRGVETKPSSEQKQVDLAASELAAFLSRMGDGKAKLATPQEKLNSRCIFVVGNERQNPLTQKLVSDGLVSLDIPQANGDGFVVRSAKKGDTDYLVFAGEKGVSTLYAVYDYLERMCDVGFFMDGDHVPSRSSVPAKNVSYSQKPFFSDRHFQMWYCYGLKKYWGRFKTVEEMTDWVSWLAKRKLNLTHYIFSNAPDWDGLASVKTFDFKCTPEESYYAGWPGGTWDIDPALRTKWLQGWFKEARDRGIRLMYCFSLGFVPPQYRKAHPELPYVPNLGYEANNLMPNSPEAWDTTGRYMKELFRLYGTDHIYWSTPFSESMGADTPEASYKIKKEAAKQLTSFLDKLDPQYTWVYDSWDFGANSNVWTPDRIADYVKSNPRMYIFDAAADMNPFWDKTNYFGGCTWGFGVLNSFQGNDDLHGNMKDLEKRVKSAVASPGSDKLRGMFHVPESNGHNMLFFQFSTELSWDPKNTNLDDYLKKYARTRYGAASAEKMLECLKNVVDAVHSGQATDMYYQHIGVTFEPSISPPFDDLHGNCMQDAVAFSKQIPFLEKAVEIALREAPNQQGNKLFENDLVNFTKMLLGIKSNCYLIKAYKAFKADDRAKFEEAAANNAKCLKAIEMILSTRPDYSLAAMINEVMAIPGTNPYLPKMIRRGCMNDMYPNCEVYEQLVLMYGPKVEAYLNQMRERVKKNVRTLTRADLSADFDSLDKKWCDNEVSVPKQEAFPGGTVEAVQKNYRATPFGETLFQPTTNKDLAVGVSLTCTPDRSSALRCIPWADGQIATSQEHGEKCWRVSGGTGGYLYFMIDDAAAYGCSEGMVISVAYLDSGKGSFTVQYDAGGNPYKTTEPTVLTDSGKWKTAVFQLKDAVCTKRQNNGADFRIAAASGTLAVARVVVSSTRNKVLPTFDVINKSK